MAPRIRSLAWLAAIAVPLALAACDSTAEDPARLEAQAQATLARWADAVAAAGGEASVVLVGEQSGQAGDWEPAVGDNNKQALMAGMVEAVASLPAETPPDGEVRWPDGTTVSVPLMSAQQAVAAIKGGAPEPCGTCSALRITAARLTSGPIETSRGPATSPIWEFSLQDTAVKLTRVAIADAATVVPPPPGATSPASGVAIESATGTPGGRQLTVAFVGAPLPGDQPCGEDYTTVAAESDLAVAVVVSRHPHVTIGACSAVGAQRTATVELAAPLGDRTVLDVHQGLPVSVALTP